MPFFGEGVRDLVACDSIMSRPTFVAADVSDADEGRGFLLVGGPVNGRKDIHGFAGGGRCSMVSDVGETAEFYGRVLCRQWHDLGRLSYLHLLGRSPT